MTLKVSDEPESLLVVEPVPLESELEVPVPVVEDVVEEVVPEAEDEPLELPVLEAFVDEVDPEVELTLEESEWFFFHFFKMLENLKVLS